MRQIICILAVMFCLFPYTQILPLESYTQPYAIAFCALAVVVMWPVIARRMPNLDVLALLALALLGMITFMLTCLPRPVPQEYKYLLIYFSPIVFAAAGFAAILAYPRIVDRVVVASAAVWIFVGLVQSTVSPDFATQLVGTFGNAAGDVVESGRGVLGLAPEPTHFGFHMVVMAATLLLVGGRNMMALACIVASVLIARSSSALLALLLGGLIYVLLFGGLARLSLLLLIPLYFILGFVVDGALLPQDWRLTVLMTEFWHDPLYLVTSDWSTNARLGGIYVGVTESLRNVFFPAGLSSADWLARIGPIMSENLWLLSLSGAGIPSGLLIVVYQLGIFGLLLVVFMLARMLTGLHSHFETFMVCTVVFVFFSQYMISTPGFGLIYGAILARRVASGESRDWLLNAAAWRISAARASAAPEIRTA